MTDRQASMPEIAPPPDRRRALRRRDPGRRARGAHAGDPAQEAAAGHARSSCSRSARARRRWPPSRSASRPFPRGRTTSPRWSGCETHLKQRHLDQVRAPLLHARRTTTATSPSGSSSARRDYPPQDNYQIDRGLFENELAARARCARESTSSRAAASRTWTSGRTTTRSRSPRPRPRRRCRRAGSSTPPGRASLLKRKLGPGQGGRPHDQLRLAPAGRRPRLRAVGGRQRRSGWPRCPSRACASTAPTTCSARATGSG